jgi:N-acetylneuraminate synthase/N,N'-diacetyllegionaminate synthase
LARKRRPVLLSTGMADLEEVRAAVELVRGAGAPDVVLFQCTSSYPAPPEVANLNVMRTYRESFGAPVGYSDHTAGTATALASVALGAATIEKHFTLDRGLPGPDHLASLEPATLTALIAGIREVEAALGSGDKSPAPIELDTRDLVRRSLFARRPIPAGQQSTTTR